MSTNQNNDYSSQQNPLIDQGLQYFPQGVQYLLQHYQQYCGRQFDSQNNDAHQQMQMMQMQQMSHPAAQNVSGYQDDLNLDEFGVPRPVATPPTVLQNTTGQYEVQFIVPKYGQRPFRLMNLPTSSTVSPCTVAVTGPIEVKLKNEEIWKKFDNVVGGNEMLTTIRGRDLFPRLDFLIKNLQTFDCYIIGIKLRRINEALMKHTKKIGWYESRESADQVPLESNEVQTVIKTGGDFMKEGVGFGNVKIYNIQKQMRWGEAPRKRKANGESFYPERRRTVDLTSALLVSTQCIYMPIVTVYEVQPCGGPMKKLSEFNFPIAKFHVVTEYKNPKICELKILHNDRVPGDIKKTLTNPKATISKRWKNTTKSKNSEDPRLSRTWSSDSGTSSMGSLSPGLPPVSTCLTGNRMVSTSSSPTSSEGSPRGTVGPSMAKIDEIDEMS